jgi:hypothetical protein
MQRRNSNFIQILHTIVGLISLILVLLLVFTGLLLNHRDKLSLHEKYPTNSLVLWLYGFQENGKAEENYVETPPTWERVITAFHTCLLISRCNRSPNLVAGYNRIIYMVKEN